MSSDINLNVEDLNNSQSSVTKISETFYPDGKPTYTNTTQSKEDLTGRSLTSSDPLKVLQGEGIYRNPAFAINGYMQNVQSSMHPRSICLDEGLMDNPKLHSRVSYLVL